MTTPDPAPHLPTGYRCRAGTPADLDDIADLVAGARHAPADRGAVAAVYARDGLDPARDTLLVHDAAGRPAAWAWSHRRCQVEVHPAHRGRGLGGALLEWAETRARQAGTGQLTQTVPDADTAAVGLLRARGYAPLVTEWLLEIDTDTVPAPDEPPPGVGVRSFRPDDGPAAHRLIQDAFDEWQQRRSPYREWAAHTVQRDTFLPVASPVALAGTALVGAVLSLESPGSDEAVIEQVAVRGDHRQRGIARLLLRHAFRAAARRARRVCTLGTHSDTGALSLYQRVGMSVRHSSTVYRTNLRVGEDGPATTPASGS